MTIEQCKILKLTKVHEVRGSLTFIEGSNHIPFDIKRVYYLYDVPDETKRGKHGHEKLQQFIIAMSGSFDVVLDDGQNKKTFTMNRPSYGLYVAPMMWREVINFSHGAVCLVLASENYDENDYFRNYDEFMKKVKENKV